MQYYNPYLLSFFKMFLTKSFELQPSKLHHLMTNREIKEYFGVDTLEEGKKRIP